MFINIIIATFIASSYIFSIYYKRPKYTIGQDRNNIDVIRYRLRRITLLTIILTICIPLLLNKLSMYEDYETGIREFGLLPGFTSTYSLYQDLKNCCKCLQLILILYIGPILNYAVYAKLTTDIWINDFKIEFLTLPGFRDNIFGPLTEELIYRSIIITILKPVISINSIIIYSPFLFGIAHVHHGYELYKIEKLSISNVIINSIVQTLYTTLFGMLTNYLFMKYANLLGCTVVHSICNLIGLPNFLISGSLFYKFNYYLLLIIGVYSFYRFL